MLVDSQVERVLFEDQTAVGVVYRPNPEYQPGGSSQLIKSKRMVILTCGTLGTPLVPERSGTGNPEISKRAGVSPIADVCGVGHEYEDHQSTMHPYKSTLKPEETMDQFLTGRVDPKDLMGWNAVDVQTKIRPTDAEVSSLGPEFREIWDREFKEVPDKPLTILSPCAG